MTDTELIDELTQYQSDAKADYGMQSPRHRLRFFQFNVTTHADRLLALARRAVELEAENKRLLESLDRIANPVKYLREDAKASGRRIDGVMANLHMNNANGLRKIAIDALDAKPGGES